MYNTQSEFLKHTACPICGSKDNLAIYTDHEWCFGCGHYKAYKINYAYRHQMNQPDTRTIIYLPEDVNTSYPALAEEWIKKYDLSINTLYKNRVLWSESKKLLIFPLYDDQNILWGWQGRYFGNDPNHPKWTSKGKYKDLIKIFNSTECKEHGIILVEDIISSIKISSIYSSSCLYGSHIDISKYINIYNIYKPKKYIIWLDYDKRKEAKEFSLMLNNLGLLTQVVITPKDPKEYSQQEIRNIIEPKNLNHSSFTLERNV